MGNETYVYANGDNEGKKAELEADNIAGPTLKMITQKATENGKLFIQWSFKKEAEKSKKVRNEQSKLAKSKDFNKGTKDLLQPKDISELGDEEFDAYITGVLERERNLQSILTNKRIPANSDGIKHSDFVPDSPSSNLSFGTTESNKNSCHNGSNKSPNSVLESESDSDVKRFEDDSMEESDSPGLKFLYKSVLSLNRRLRAEKQNRLDHGETVNKSPKITKRSLVEKSQNSLNDSITEKRKSEFDHCPDFQSLYGDNFTEKGFSTLKDLDDAGAVEVSRACKRAINENNSSLFSSPSKKRKLSDSSDEPISNRMNM